MQRYLLVAAIVGSSLGCSCMGSVVVANPTDHPVAIFVTPEQLDSTNKWCNCPGGYKLGSYGTTSTVAPDSFLRTKWVALDSSAFHWDSSGRTRKLTIAVMLAPGSTLRVGDAGYSCGGGLIGQDIPALIEIVDSGQQIRLDAIALKDRARKGTKYLLMYEIPGARPDSTS